MSHSGVQNIGILGGGQLGLMLSDSLSKLGARVHVLDPDPLCPAARHTPYVTHASFLDESALSAFFSKCDRVTYEFEHIPTQALRNILKNDEHRNKLWPSVEILEIAQNRIAEKTALSAIGVPLANWEPVKTLAQLLESKAKWLAQGKAAILKTAKGCYDGKGQWVLKSELDWQALLSSVSQFEPFPDFVLEEKCTLLTELSVIVARHPEYGTVALPAVENIHVNGILDTTLSPPRIETQFMKDAERISEKIAHELNICGIVCVEFFLVSQSGQPTVIVNEIAPRPHNSGHITRCSLTRSQFYALAQILLDLPVATEPIAETVQWAMWNTLGDLWLNPTSENPVFWPKEVVSNAHVCEAMLYGKTQARAGRKMGHVILKHQSPEQVFSTIDTLKNAFKQHSRK